MKENKTSGGGGEGNRVGNREKADTLENMDSEDSSILRKLF